jgi:5'-nucleotidase
MKRIAVDMDGVLADVYSQFSKRHAKEFGRVLAIEEIVGVPELEAFPNSRKYVTTPGFFRHAPVIAGSQEILARLNNQYQVFIVSSATEFPLSLSEKQAWLNKHFSFISWKQMVFCGSKEIIQADIMIDDHFKNLDHFSGQTYLFNQPHNQLADPGRHTRVHSWGEIEKQLLP